MNLKKINASVDMDNQIIFPEIDTSSLEVSISNYKEKIKNLKQNIEELYFELGEVEEKLDEAQEDLILFNTINMKKRNGV
jgi:chromosome segregation ATPase